MAMLTGHIHRRDMAVGCESVPRHDCSASWPGEPTGFRLLARGFPGALNDPCHVSSDGSCRVVAHDLLCALKWFCSTRRTEIRCRIRCISSRIPVPIKGHSWEDSSSSPNALVDKIKKENFLFSSSSWTLDRIGHGSQDQADCFFFKGDRRRGPEGQLLLCAGCCSPRSPR